MIKIRHVFLLLLTAGLLIQPVVGQVFTVSGRVEVGDVTDLDANDGFDFEEEFTDSFWRVQFLLPFDEPELISNTIVDGGSRTVYSGSKISILRVDFTISCAVTVGEYVLWDRADFDQHVVEFDFVIGDSEIEVILVADSTLGNSAFGNMFQVNSPKPNTGIQAPFSFNEFDVDVDEIYSNVEIRIQAGAEEFGGAGAIVTTIDALAPTALKGDVNRDGNINLLDIAPFVELVISGEYQEEADING